MRRGQHEEQPKERVCGGWLTGVVATRPPCSGLLVAMLLEQGLCLMDRATIRASLAIEEHVQTTVVAVLVVDFVVAALKA